MYSSAIFTDSTMTLHDAQVARLDLICGKLQLKPTDRLLEIGAGWGGLAVHAATRYGCHVTTTTISKQQYDLICERVAAAGLNDRITVLCTDYRDLTGHYDKLVSLEMIEAVGYHYFDAYFEACSRLLKSEGMMLLQAITIADQRYEAAKRSVDFIQRYIFPGSCIPSITAMGPSPGPLICACSIWRTLVPIMSRRCEPGATIFTGTGNRYSGWATPRNFSGCGNSIFVIAKGDLRNASSATFKCC